MSVIDEIAPSPIPKRECNCGCGHEFQPRRRDQVYLNRQHANFAYNHGKRKVKSLNKIKEEKILTKNDNILDKHFRVKENTKYVNVYYDILRADGFNFGYQVGKMEEGDIEYYFTYNYYYNLFILNNIKMIKILKR